MVGKEHDLSQRRQCTLLQLSRSTLYYRPKGESAESKADQKTIRGIGFPPNAFHGDHRQSVPGDPVVWVPPDGAAHGAAGAQVRPSSR
jgi:hypothetical protein